MTIKTILKAVLILNLLCLSLPSFAFNGKTPKKFIELICSDCQPNRYSAENFLQKTINNISDVHRLFYIKVDTKHKGNGKKATFFIFSIGKGKPSTEAVYHGRSGLPCPPCERDIQ